MQKSILIVEDDKAIAEMYQIKFQADGYHVIAAENGKDGLAQAEKCKPDIILLDIMMPEMRGDEMLRIMRQTEWGKSIKVVILTNVSEDETDVNINDLGVSGFIVKAHYTPHQVVETIQKLLS